MSRELVEFSPLMPLLPFMVLKASGSLPPSRDARLGDRNGRFGIMATRALLLGALPHPDVLRRRPLLRQRPPGSAPCRTSALDQRVWAGGR